MPDLVPMLLSPSKATSRKKLLDKINMKTLNLPARRYLLLVSSLKKVGNDILRLKA